MSKDSRKKAQRSEDGKDAKILRLESSLDAANRNLLALDKELAELRAKLTVLAAQVQAEPAPTPVPAPAPVVEEPTSVTEETQRPELESA